MTLTQVQAPAALLPDGTGSGSPAPPQSPRHRGRPRSASADRAILAAALRLLVDLGYARMSVEAVAAEAKVGKTTIYRRYSHKPEMAGAAVAAALGPVASIDAGSTRADMLTYLRNMRELFLHGPGIRIAALIATEELSHPELIVTVRQHLIHPRRAVLRACLERGVARGEVRPDLDLDAVADVLANAVFGPYFTGRAVGEDWTNQVVDVIWRGIKP